MNIETVTTFDEDMTVMPEPQFDEYGRCMPGSLNAAAHQQSRRYFQIDQPEINFDNCYQCLTKAFNLENSLSVDDFKQRVESILAKLAKDESTKGILNGVYVPFILPKASYDDIGSALENDYFPLVTDAYAARFPEYSFTNHSLKSLQNQLSVTEHSRHQTVIDAMSQDVVVGVYFPCLLEYSIPAAVEMMANLPESFSLAGGFDTAAAFISAPELLFKKEGYPPLLWLSGLTSVEDTFAYHFEAYGYDLTFNRRVHLNQVAEYWASGITVLG